MPQTAPLQSVTLGSFKVTYLPDGGGIVIPQALYPASTAEGWQNHQDLLDGEGKFITTIGSFLVEAGERKIAVDLGIGPVYLDFPGFGPFFGGKYLESLAQTGTGRADVTDVIFTHLHLDHVGWTTMEEDGQRVLTYPNARYWTSKAEWDTWFGGDAPIGPHPEAVQKPLADKIQFLEDGQEFVPGLKVLFTPGHTPGHLSLELTAGDQKLYLVGDLFHGAMQMEEPTWCVAFDATAEGAMAARAKMYPLLTKPGVMVAANHFSNTVFGTIRPQNGHHVWQPLP